MHAPKIRCIGTHGFEMDDIEHGLMIDGIKCLYMTMISRGNVAASYALFQPKYRILEPEIHKYRFVNTPFCLTMNVVA